MFPNQGYGYPPPAPPSGDAGRDGRDLSGWQTTEYPTYAPQTSPQHGQQQTAQGLGGWFMPGPPGPSHSNGNFTPQAMNVASSNTYAAQQSVQRFSPAGREGTVTTGVDSAADTPPTKVEKAPASKKKRKKSVMEVEDASVSGDGDKEKRTKTGRACDACRTKKIRCDILIKSPSPSASGDAQPICAHCKQYNLECTFFLPITETRFKKRKADEANDVSARSGVVDTSPAKPQEAQHRVEGPTSLSFLLHTTVPSSTSEAYDLRNHTSWEVTEDGNGLIRVKAPPIMPDENGHPPDPSLGHGRLNRPFLSSQTISHLVNAYFDHLCPLFPIISRAEFASKQNPSPLLLYAICGLGSTRRQFPREVFAGVRGMINGLLRSNDILSDARLENVQALLLLSQVGDLHAQPTAATASAALIRTGTATRMAQDLGLHRESTLRAQTAQDLAYVELRRRIWAACVILDRWYGSALGIPLLVDLLDCDVLLPAPYDIIPDTDPGSWHIDLSYIGLAEHLKLSILMGRVLKTIYSPTGLKLTTEDQLRTLLADMESWMENLPSDLRFHGKTSSHIVGMLHMGYCALQFLFWRVFMRITHTLPPQIKIGVEVERWSRLVRWSAESIEWLAANDDTLDSVFIFSYAATSCALVQYHTWAKRRDQDALNCLRTIKETAQKWEAVVQPDQMSIRRKTCETMTLLYEAALKTRPDHENDTTSRPPAINPTAGVHPRPAFGKAKWVKDPSRPGGGIYVAQDADELDQAGLQNGDIVIASDEQKGVIGERSQPDLPSETSLQPNQQTELLQSMQMAANNLNPQMNTDAFGDTADLLQGGQVESSEIVGFLNNSNAFDTSLLDGLPMSGFNWNEWSNFFEQVDKVADGGLGQDGNSLPPPPGQPFGSGA